MSDGATIILPQQQRTIPPNEAGMASRLGAPLQARPPEHPDFAANDTGPEIVIDNGDVRVTVEEINAPAVHGTGTQDENPNFDENLAETVDDGTLGQIAEEIVQGVEADIQSRSGWIEQYQKGIDLLGLKIEEAQNASEKGISRANHPLLIEAMVKYAASADGELLPAAGPAKVMTIGTAPQAETELASDFEDDLNYFLTEVAKEYYPDTSAMLMHQAYCGLGFKKVYRCPIRRRPVSESVLAPDLIVSEEATDLDSALRVTNQIMMGVGQLKRMQLVGQYRDIALGTPSGSFGIGQQARRAINAVQGLNATATRPQDQPYTIYETDYELLRDIYPITGKYERKAPDGLPLPYKITVDRDSHQVLGIWRNWNPEDPLYLKRNMYVKYGMVPGLGFHSWGFLQLLGNQTRALRSCLRILIDAGMFSSFPGGLKAGKARTSTNEYAPRPGEWIDVDMTASGPNFDIRKYFMPMPYNPPNPVFIQLMDQMKQDAMRLGGTVMLEVGEGRTNMPVGTILATIEQQMQVMAAVHKRNHRAQKEELRKLRELFAEKPDDLARLCRERPRDANRQARLWEKAEEFTNLNLVPATDPNAPSKMHSIMMANVLIMLAQQFPQLMDVVSTLKNGVRAIGSDPDAYVKRPDQINTQPPPDPRVIAKTIDAQTKHEEAAVQAKTSADKIALDREKLALEGAKAAAMNETSLGVEQAKQAGQMAQTHADHAHQMAKTQADNAHDLAKTAADNAHEHALTDRQAGHDLNQASHEAALAPPPAIP